MYQGKMELLQFMTIKQACILRKALVIFLFLIDKCGCMFADDPPISRDEVADLLNELDNNIKDFYKAKAGIERIIEK